VSPVRSITIWLGITILHILVLERGSARIGANSD
jgi:hypothetical protein